MAASCHITQADSGYQNKAPPFFKTDTRERQTINWKFDCAVQGSVLVVVVTKRLPNRQPEVENIDTKICHLFGCTVLVLFSSSKLSISLTTTSLARVGASTKAIIIKVSE
jgi:hypothetical protein